MTLTHGGTTEQREDGSLEEDEQAAARAYLASADAAVDVVTALRAQQLGRVWGGVWEPESVAEVESLWRTEAMRWLPSSGDAPLLALGSNEPDHDTMAEGRANYLENASSDDEDGL